MKKHIVGFQQYIYKGENIGDPIAWAKERGERIVKYKNTKEAPNPYTGKIETHITYGEMPECFWNTLRMDSDSGFFEEVK